MEQRKDLQRIAYEKYYELYKHYSGLIYQARILIITLSLIIIVYLLGISLSANVPTGLLENVYLRIGLAYLCSLIVIIFFKIEKAYVERGIKVINAARLIEKEYELDLYFSRFDEPSRWSIYAIYFFAILIFVAIFLWQFMNTYSAIWAVTLASVASACPLILFLRELKHSPYDKLDRKKEPVLSQ